jgi:hypothetical protein
MRVQITKEGGYACAPHGHTVERFERLSVVTGRAAECALADGAGKAMFEAPPLETQAMATVPETKRKRGRPRK